MDNSRIITTAHALQEATWQAMEHDDRVIVIGEGVPDPKAIFGTTAGLQEKFGNDRVFDMPVAENGMTGVVIGAALAGMRPLLTHQRVDFALYSLDQIFNNAAKWRFMFAEQVRVPIVIRMVIGRGWGQGAQHSQSLQALFAHIPGLKVVMPATPFDAKGLLIQALWDDDPVIFLEDRWIHSMTGHVPPELYTVALGKADVKHIGDDITIVASSYMTIEALRAAAVLKRIGITAEVVDVRSLRPLDEETLLTSVRKTGRLLAVDSSWETGSFAGEIIARISASAWDDLRAAPARVALPDHSAPSSPALTKTYYRTWRDITLTAAGLLAADRHIVDQVIAAEEAAIDTPHDVPDHSFAGPF